MSEPKTNSEGRHPWNWPFDKVDWIPAGVAWLVSQVLYFVTAQPNVGLLDSGEFLVAAVHVGVPHPTGYPLWTIFSHFFTLFPIGNGAWEVNLFSGFCTAIAVGLVSLILTNSMRWAGVGDRLAQGLALGWSLALACSVSMWSQAVIAEVYGLHSLCVMLFTVSLYRWLRDSRWTHGLAWGAFFYALGMSNHHLMISLAILLVLVLALIRRDFLAEGLLYLAGVAALVYWGFGYLSQEVPTWHSSVRFLWCVGVAFILWMVVRRRLEHWRTGLLVLVGVVAGLSPYAYMPMASSTNPPMNWGFTSTKEGFFYSFNRSQYDGKLSDQLLKTIGRAMGATPPEMIHTPASADPNPPSFRENFMKFAALYWRKIVENFSPLGLLALVLAFLLSPRLTGSPKKWILTCAVGLLLSGFLQPAFAGVGADEASWLLQMPYLGYSHAFFVLLAGFGSGLALQRCGQRIPALAIVATLLGLGIAGWSFRQNLEFCSQRVPGRRPRPPLLPAEHALHGAPAGRRHPRYGLGHRDRGRGDPEGPGPHQPHHRRRDRPAALEGQGRHRP